MNIGFTGTRKGMTYAQYKTLKQLLSERLDVRFEERAVHGDCIGADAEFHVLIQKYYPHVKIIIYPSNIKSTRAHCIGAEIVFEERDPLKRNHDIVDNCDILFATPHEAREILRSGTWAAIRYCRKIHHSIYVIWPNGDSQSW